MRRSGHDSERYPGQGREQNGGAPIDEQFGVTRARNGMGHEHADDRQPAGDVDGNDPFAPIRPRLHENRLRVLAASRSRVRAFRQRAGQINCERRRQVQPGEERVVVSDHDERSPVAEQGVDELVDALPVEIVAGFVGADRSVEVGGAESEVLRGVEGTCTGTELARVSAGTAARKRRESSLVQPHVGNTNDSSLRRSCAHTTRHQPALTCGSGSLKL